MAITRLEFAAGIDVAPGLAALPATSNPRLVVRLCGPLFTCSMAHDVDAAWLSLCVTRSCWQIDRRSFDKRAFIRHTMTGLTYVIFPWASGRAVVQQVDPVCCRNIVCREDLDPDFIVGHAARRAAAESYSFWSWPHQGPVYLRFATTYAPWPKVPAPEFTSAPPIELVPLTVEALAEVRDEIDA
jgi:hypothetical protein